jgi:hypothetical protein
MTDVTSLETDYTVTAVEAVRAAITTNATKAHEFQLKKASTWYYNRWRCEHQCILESVLEKRKGWYAQLADTYEIEKMDLIEHYNERCNGQFEFQKNCFVEDYTKIIISSSTQPTPERTELLMELNRQQLKALRNIIKARNLRRIKEIKEALLRLYEERNEEYELARDTQLCENYDENNSDNSVESNDLVVDDHEYLNSRLSDVEEQDQADYDNDNNSD